MDSLLISLNKLSFYKNVENFKTDLDDIIDKMNKQNIDSDTESEGGDYEDIEWNTIRENYTKLKFLDNFIKDEINNSLIENFSAELNTKFNLVLENVMQDVDDSNIHYLEGINWEDAKNYVSTSQEIERLIRLSVNLTNPYLKMQKCIEAYDLFIPVIEMFRGESYTYDTIRDQQFIEELDSLKRKRS